MATYASTQKQDNSPEESTDHSITKYYAVNHDATCIFVTTTPDQEKIPQSVLDTFARASVLFLAISTALSKNGKSLFDFDSYAQVLSQSGYFSPMELQKKTFVHNDLSLSIQLDVIAELIGAAVAPEAEMALTEVIGAVGNELNASTAKSSSVSRVAKAMLWVEELMGIPDISVQLWYVDRSDSGTILKTPCVNTTTSKVTFNYSMQEFVFVDPAWINQFTSDFKDNPDFDALVAKMGEPLAAQA